MQTRAVFFFSLLHGKNPLTQASELGQFLLDFLESFMPLAVGDLSFGFGARLTAVLGRSILEAERFQREDFRSFHEALRDDP